MKKILVSACLMGENCRYKGDNCKNDFVLKLKEKYKLIPICPEQHGGLLTPREPSERVLDRVISKNGKDVTKQYLIGAEEALRLAKENNVEFCILKSNSPSCGKGIIYDGTFTGKKISGNGITTDLLQAHGFKVYNEDELLNGEIKEIDF